MAVDSQPSGSVHISYPLSRYAPVISADLLGKAPRKFCEACFGHHDERKMWAISLQPELKAEVSNLIAMDRLIDAIKIDSNYSGLKLERQQLIAITLLIVDDLISRRL